MFHSFLALGSVLFSVSAALLVVHIYIARAFNNTGTRSFAASLALVTLSIACWPPYDMRVLPFVAAVLALLYAMMMYDGDMFLNRIKKREDFFSLLFVMAFAFSFPFLVYSYQPLFIKIILLIKLLCFISIFQHDKSFLYYLMWRVIVGALSFVYLSEVSLLPFFPMDGDRVYIFMMTLWLSLLFTVVIVGRRKKSFLERFFFPDREHKRFTPHSDIRFHPESEDLIAAMKAYEKTVLVNALSVPKGVDFDIRVVVRCILREVEKTISYFPQKTILSIYEEWSYDEEGKPWQERGELQLLVPLYKTPYSGEEVREPRLYICGPVEADEHRKVYTFHPTGILFDEAVQNRVRRLAVLVSEEGETVSPEFAKTYFRNKRRRMPEDFLLKVFPHEND